MPITVACPNCQARLTAPDAAAGKRVKCAKCQQLIAIPDNAPGYEVVEAPPPKSGPVTARRATPIEPARPKPRVTVDDDEDDDRPVRKSSPDEEEDEDDRPRTRTRRRDDEEDDRPAKKKRSYLPLVIGGAVVGLVLIVGCGLVGVYLLNRPSDGGPRTGGSGPAAGGAGPLAAGPTWVPFEGPEQNFVAKFPNAAPEKKDPLAQISDPEQRKLAEMIGKIDLWVRTDGGRTYTLTVRDLGVVLPAAQVKTVLDNIGTMTASATPGGKMTQVDSTSGEWKGYPFKQYTMQKPTGQIVLVRAIIAKSTMYVLGVEGDAGLTASDKMAGEYLDGFEPKPKDPPGKKPKDAPKGGTPKGKKP